MRERAERPPNVTSVRAVRLGAGANCSSVGSVVDTLFVTAAAGAAIFAAICAAMAEEPVRVVAPPNDDGDTDRDTDGDTNRDEAPR